MLHNARNALQGIPQHSSSLYTHHLLKRSILVNKEEQAEQDQTVQGGDNKNAPGGQEKGGQELGDDQYIKKGQSGEQQRWRRRSNAGQKADLNGSHAQQGSRPDMATAIKQ